MAWTDARIDDLAGRMDAGFTRVDGEIQGLRTDITLLRSDMHSEFRNVRTESRHEINALRAEVKGDIEALRSAMFRFGIAILIGMAGVIATLIGAIATGSLAG